MKKKPHVLPFPVKAVADHWHNGGSTEIAMYARSLHRTARDLVTSLDMKPTAKTAWDGCPALLLYRQALELYLKLLIDEGMDFLPSPIDFITLCKTHSIRWLTQIVSQIVRNSGLEKDFKCKGVATLSEFRALINEVEDLDPVTCAITIGRSRRDGSIPAGLEPPKIAHLAQRLDAVLDLLDVVTDALAATTDMVEFGGFNQTIQ